MTKKVNVQIPFCGYYETILTDCFDREIEYFIESCIDDYYNNPIDIIENEQLKTKIEAIPKDKLLPILGDLVWRYDDTPNENYNKFNRQHVIDFCAIIKQEYGIDLKPHLDSIKMSSPKYYNFETDRLFCDVSFNAIKTLYEENKTQCDDYIFNRMKPRSGFIPFYSNNTNEWGEFEDWDFNQWGLVLEALMTDEIDEMIKDCHCEYYAEFSLSISIDDLFSEVLEIYERDK